MMKTKEFNVSLLIAVFQDQGRILKFADLRAIIESNRSQLKIPKALTTPKIIDRLISEGLLEKIEFDFPFRKEVRYGLGYLKPLEKLQLTYPTAYYSHQTAAVFNKLLPSPLTQIFVNNEQKPITQFDRNLTQEGIDIAFRNKPRITSNTIRFDKYQVYLLNGKHTACLGVATIVLDSGEGIRVTNVERTLIDLVVRPFYAGGPISVLQAFRNAKPLVSISRIYSMLNQIDYTYPYHQSIGFYLQASDCFQREEIDLFRQKEFNYDFYLTHSMKNPAYSKEWRLYFPKELQGL